MLKVIRCRDCGHFIDYHEEEGYCTLHKARQYFDEVCGHHTQIEKELEQEESGRLDK